MLKMQIIGHLGKDCTVNTVNGKNVINFSLAHTEKFRDAQGNPVEKTTWVDCSYWTEKTAIAQYLTKGKQVYSDGTPELRTYQKNDGTPGTSLVLRVRDIQLLGGKNDSGSSYAGNTSSAGSSSGNSVAATSDVADASDDLPF